MSSAQGKSNAWSWVILLAALLLGGCDWLWPQEGPYDPTRCQPRCAAGQVCHQGRCVSPDGGADASPDAGPG